MIEGKLCDDSKVLIQALELLTKKPIDIKVDLVYRVRIGVNATATSPLARTAHAGSLYEAVRAVVMAEMAEATRQQR